MEISAIIGNNLQQLRKEQGLSLDQLALKTGVSKAVLSQLENGKVNPTINTIWKIATALHVTYSALLEPPRENVQKWPIPTCAPIERSRPVPDQLLLSHQPGPRF